MPKQFELIDIKMFEENRNHQAEENHTSKKRRFNSIYESGTLRYNPYPEGRDKHSYKNRNQTYQNGNRKNYHVDDRFDKRYHYRNHNNFKGRNNNPQIRNSSNGRSETAKQRDDRFQLSHENRERKLILPVNEEDFLMDSPEAPISGPSETKTNDMRSTDASSFKDLLPLHRNNVYEIILTNDEEDFLLDTPEASTLKHTETETINSSDASSFKDLSLHQIKEDEIILTDDEDGFLLDTPEASMLTETKSNDMRSTDPFNFKNLLSPTKEEKIILSDFEVIISDVPSVTKTNAMRSTDASVFENYGEDHFLPDYEEDSPSDTPEAPTSGLSGTNDMRSTDISSFKDLLLKVEIVKSLDTGGYEHPSEIQSECIPQALSGHDILAQAQSGTGKTLAFILSTLHLLETREKEVHTLVICPTRELAHQIGKQYECFSKHLPGIKIATFFGGLPIKHDVNVLKNNCPHIVVGTVGRILSLIKSRNLGIQYLKHFVLDECDQMLQLPNTNRQIQEIYLSLPREKQVLMFSATLNEETRNECKRYMRNPIEIYMGDKGGLRMRGLLQHYVCLEENSKFTKLVQLLDSLQYTQVVIFVKSISRCTNLEYLLLTRNYSAIGIHGGMNQPDRLERFEEVKNGKKRILVATNVFGRGMDVGGISAVINYDMPGNPDTYLHGVARAGRFDTKGIAITFLANEEDTRILNEVQRKFKVEITKLSS